MGVKRSSASSCCAHLRWKGMFVEAEMDPEFCGPGDGFYWCERTMTCLGPDGQLARPDRCTPERSCHPGRLRLEP